MAVKISRSDAVLNAQHIGNACYGLQGVKEIGESDTVGALVSALAAKISASNAVLNAQAIGNACCLLVCFSQYSDMAFLRLFVLGFKDLVTRYNLTGYDSMDTDDTCLEDMMRHVLDGLSHTENVLIETVADKFCFYTGLIECMYYFVKDKDSAKYMVKDLLKRNRIYSRVVFIAENILKIDLQHHRPITAVLALESILDDKMSDSLDTVLLYVPHEHGSDSIPSQVKNALSEYVVSDAFEQKYLFCLQEQREERGYITLVRIPSHNTIGTSRDSCSSKRKRDNGGEDVKGNEIERHGETGQGLADIVEPSRKSSKVTSSYE